ncbi:MAG: tetratricopeptide repeat protein [Acidobacteria bacterium]|nr:tetratricopeptide repeat protein [Acidobacteriota bacterium]
MRTPSMRIHLTLALALFLSLPRAAVARQDHACAGPVGYVPGEVLERPVGLREGVGKIHDPATTSSPEAQALYDQGVAYLHSYVWIEAARSFHQALKADPDLAMAWVGLSRAYSGLDDPGAAEASLAKARTLAGRVSARERRRIELRGRQLEAMAEPIDPQKLLDYRKAIDEALAADDGDAELWLVGGNAQEPSAAGRGQRGGLGSTLYYLHVLAMDPDNFAAHHYLVHSYETMGKVDDALRHGEAYVKLAPMIPHAHHMYGHDLRRVGRIEEAIARFRRADELEQAYYAAEKIPAGLDWHHKHNLDLLATSYEYMGRMGTAEELMKQAADGDSVNDYLEFNRKEWPAFLMSRGRLDEALAAVKSLTHGKWAVSRAAGHALEGEIHLAAGRIEAARGSLDAAQKALLEVPEVAPGITLPRGAAQPIVEELKARILLATGKADEARPIFVEVVRRTRAIPGPDAWSQALFRLESIARAARDAGDWELADFTAKQMMEHDPAYAGSHLAAGLVAGHRGDAAAEGRELAEARRLWSGADAGLPELAEIRAKIAAAAP